MSAIRAFNDLRGRGVVLTAVDGRISIDAPAGAISPTEREILAKYKAELVAELEREQPFLADGWMLNPDGAGLVLRPERAAQCLWCDQSLMSGHPLACAEHAARLEARG